MGKILDIKTEQGNTIKILAEVLKDLLPEGNLEFIKSNINYNDSDSDSDSENDSDNSNSETSDNVIKKDKSGLKIVAVDTSKTVLLYINVPVLEQRTILLPQ